jgi:hypothetical protein
MFRGGELRLLKTKNKEKRKRKRKERGAERRKTNGGGFLEFLHVF